MIRKPLIACVWALILIATGTTVAQGQTTYTWNGGGSDTNWSTSANWTASSGSPPPVSDATNTLIVLAGTTRLTNVMNLAPGATFDINSLSFASGAGAFVVNASSPATTLRIGTGGIASSATNTETLNIPIALLAPQTWATNNTGALTVSGTVNLGANTLSLGGSGTGAINLSGIVSGTGGITKIGNASEVTTLSNAANTYTGVTTVSGGILATGTLTNGGAASGIGQSTNAAGNLVLDGGTFRYTGGAISTDRLFTVTANGGTLQQNGSGAVTFANTGAIVFNGGTPTTFTLDGTSTAANILAPVIGDGAGATSLVKNGAGYWILAATNTYTGGTTINAGTLQINSPTTVIGNVTLGNSGAFAAGYAIDQTFLGRVANPTTSGSVALGVSSANNLDFNAASFTAARLGAAPGTTVNYTGTLTPNGNVYRFGSPSGGTLTLPNVLPDVGGVTSVDMGAGGTVNLNGANTFTGTTTISGGVLAVSVLGNGGAASGIGQVSNAASNLTLSGGTLRYTGAGGSTDRLFTLGTSGGSVDASGSGAINFTNTGAIAFNGGTTRTLTLTGTTGQVNTFQGTGYTIPLSVAFNTFNPVISDGAGATSVTKSGTGTWQLVNPNTYTGTTNVSAGTLAINRLTTGSTPVGSGTLQLSGGTISFRAQSNPLTVTGFTQDVISSYNDIASPNPFGTTSAIDGAPGSNSGFALLENRPDFLTAYTIPTTYGLPSGGKFVHLNNPATTFQMAAYDGGGGGVINRNSLYLSTAAGTTGTLTLSSPGKFQVLNVLATSGNGASSYTATLHFSDGSSSTYSGLSSPDWFNGANPAIQTGVRMTLTDGTPNNTGPANPQLYSQEIFLTTADQAKTLNSIGFAYTQNSGSSLNIFGVSGAAVGGANSYANNVNVTASSTLQMLNTGSLSFGTLSIGSFTLTTNTQTASPTALTFTGTTLTGNPTFNIAAAQTFTPGPINFSSAARTIATTGGGIVNFDTTATGVTATNTLTVNGGTTNVTNATSLTTASSLLNLNVGGGTANMGPYATLNTVSVTSGTANLPNVTSVASLTTSGGTTNFGTGVAISGTTTVNGGTVNLGGATSTSRLAGSGGTIALGANNLTFGSGNASDTYAGTITGSGSINKVGTGTQTLSGPSSTYSGGTNINAGRVTATRPGTIGTGTVTFQNGTTLGIGGLPGTTIAGFGGNGSGWTLNGGPTVSGDVLTITTAAASEARSAWFNTQYNIPSIAAGNGAFTATFKYSDSVSGGGADGTTFTIQSQSATALGGNGGSLGLAGITPSASLEINIYGPNNPGIALRTGGVTGTPYTSTTPIVTNVSTPGNEITFTITYDGTNANLLMTQGANTFNSGPIPLNLTGAAGNNVWVGFTGGTGGVNAQQVISGFSFNWTGTSTPGISTYSNSVTLPNGVSGTITPMVAAGITTFAMGNLSVGSGSTLVVMADAGSLTDSPYNLTLGATTLNGGTTFNVANNGAGTGQLTLGAINDGGTARIITLAGNGTVNFSAAATSLVNGTQVNVNAGTLRVTNATALGTLAAVNLASATNMSLGAGQTVGALTGSGNVALNSNTLTIGSTNNLDSTFAGVIANGSGAGAVVKGGTGTLNLTGANTYTGGTTLNTGTLLVNSGGSATNSPIGTGTFTIAGGTIDNTSGSPVTLATNNAQTWNADFAYGGSNALNMGTGAVTLGGSGTARTVTTNGTAPLTVGGAIGGTLGLTKAGGGTLVLTGTSTYTGPTTVNAGTILVNGSLGNTAVTVHSGATLTGTGTINGAVTFSAGATLTPGSSASGTLTVANGVTVTGGTGSTWVVNTSADASSFPPPVNTPNNQLALTGAASNLNLAIDSSNKLTFLITPINGYNPSQGVPMSYTIATTDPAASIQTNGGTFNFDQNAYTFQTVGFVAANFQLSVTGNQLVLSFTPVPEPGMVLAIAVAMLGLLAWTRRQLLCPRPSGFKTLSR